EILIFSGWAAPQIRSSYPAKAGIQYAAASRFNRWRLWNTGAPLGACHRARRGQDPVAGEDGASWNSHHRLHAGQRIDEVAEGGAADFEVAVLIERRARWREQHDGIGESGSLRVARGA